MRLEFSLVPRSGAPRYAQAVVLTVVDLPEKEAKMWIKMEREGLSK